MVHGDTLEGPTESDESPILGMIVDRCDESEDLNSLNQLNDEDTISAGQSVVIRSGKVRRRLRWKPTSFLRNKSSNPSDASEVSALTFRSRSTKGSFFSRLSNKSLHTFHSTETPVAKNSAKSKSNSFLARPNYRDTFDETDSNNGTIRAKKLRSRRGGSLPSVKEGEASGNAVKSSDSNDSQSKPSSSKRRMFRTSSKLSTSGLAENSPEVANIPTSYPLTRDLSALPALDAEESESDRQLVLNIESSVHVNPTTPVNPRNGSPRSVRSDIYAVDVHDNAIETKAARPLERKTTLEEEAKIERPKLANSQAEYNLKAIHNMAAEHLAHEEYQEAIEVFEEILRGQQERYGRNHYRVGTALHNLGIVHLKAGNSDEASYYCRQAVEVRKDSLFPSHPDVAISLAQLGVSQLERRKFVEALVAFQESLSIRRAILGDNHLKCAKLLNNIGCSLQSLERREEALAAFEEAQTIQKNLLGNMPNDPEEEDCHSRHVLLSLASTICNIASVRAQGSEFESALVLLDEALLIQESVLEENHQMILKTRENIKDVEEAKRAASPETNEYLSGWLDRTRTSQVDKSFNCSKVPAQAMENITALNVFADSSTDALENVEGALEEGREMYDILEETLVSGKCGAIGDDFLICSRYEDTESVSVSGRISI